MINIELFDCSCATSRTSHCVWKNAQKRDPLLGVQKMAPRHNINLISSHAPHFSEPFWTPKSGSCFWSFLHPMQISVTQQCNSFNTYCQPLKNIHGLHLALKPNIIQLQLQLRGAFKATPAFCYGSRSQNWDPESLSFCDVWNNAKFTISIKRCILPSLLFNLFILFSFVSTSPHVSVCHKIRRHWIVTFPAPHINVDKTTALRNMAFHMPRCHLRRLSWT